MRWNGSIKGKTIRTNTVGGSGLWSLPAQARAARDGDWSRDTSTLDADALAYIRAVEAADKQALESNIVAALNTFVAGLKTDSVWADIEACVLLCGARTLAGALTPLKGAAPTNFNFVGADYHRYQGLLGDGSTKYLDSGRANDAAGTQDDFHMAYYNSIALPTQTAGAEVVMGCGGAGATGATRLRGTAVTGGISTPNINCRSSSGDITTGDGGFSRFSGINRSSSSDFDTVTDYNVTTRSRASQSPATGNVFVFATNSSGPTLYDGRNRLMFYTIGTATTLTAIRDRLFTFIDSIRQT
jgi:hypothetical protein